MSIGEVHLREFSEYNKKHDAVLLTDLSSLYAEQVQDHGDAENERLETAIDKIKLLSEPEAIPVTSEEHVRDIVLDEIDDHSDE